MKLAIVIPYYKISFFEETIASLANQTCLNFNIYIGDDCSPNDPIDIINKYAPKLKITYKRFNQNLGKRDLPKQWERCIDMVQNEEWIMLLGDDDYLQENLIESWYKHSKTFGSNSHLIRFSSKLISPSGKSLSIAYKHPQWEQASNSFMRKVKKESRSSLSEYIFKKEKYIKFKFHPYSLGWHSDDRAWLDFSDQKPIYTINEAVVKIRISDKSISGNQDLWEQKVESKKDFFHHLFATKVVDKFTSQQKFFLIKYFEGFLIEEDKLDVKNSYRLFNYYLFNTNPKEVFRFIRRLGRARFTIKNFRIT